MQKAASAADAFGLSFEWLGAYIATVSEKTRQAPEIIGTSMNSIMARLHSIKEKGFNEDDETRINDIAKALGTLDIALLDDEDNWRDMSDILSEVAGKWTMLDGKQQAYISTTMAGTRQQNTFLALMEDMAKGAEGGSRAYELYAGALDSAGTAAAKFAIWQESVEAAQNRLTAAVEGFYGILDADWLKGFYHGLANIVEVLTAGTTAMKGWNILLPVLTLGIGGVVAMVIKLVVALKAASGAMGVLSVLTGGGLPAILALVGVAVTAVTGIVGMFSKATEPMDLSGYTECLGGHINEVKDLKAEYEELADKESRTVEESQRMQQILERMAKSSTVLSDALRDNTGEFLQGAEAIKAYNDYLFETEERFNSIQRMEATDVFKDVKPLGDARDALEQVQSWEELLDAYQKFREDEAAYEKHKGNFNRYAYDQAWDSMFTSEYGYWDKMFVQIQKLAREKKVRVGNNDAMRLMMEEFVLDYGGMLSKAEQDIESEWDKFSESLEFFATGPKLNAMSKHFQDQMKGFFGDIMDGLMAQDEIKSGDLVQAAATLSEYLDTLYGIFTDTPELEPLFSQYEAMLGNLSTENLDAINDLITRINTILQTQNEGLAPDMQIPLLNLIAEDDIEKIKAADMELALFSEKLDAFMDKLKRKREAKAAGDNLYLEQVQGLRDAWEQDPSGDGFARMLNEFYASNEELAEGLLETHEAMAQLLSGELDYTQGLAALTEMERLAVRQSQEHTQKLLEEAEATDKLTQAKEGHYHATLQELQAAYGEGYDAFVGAWTLLDDSAKKDIIALYPEVARLATAMGETGDGAVVFADALELATKMDLSKFADSLSVDYAAQQKRDAAAQAKESGFAPQLASLEDALKTDGVEAMRDALGEVYLENEALYASLMETYPVLLRLGDAALTNAGAAQMMADAYGTQGRAAAEAVTQMLKQLQLEEQLEESAKNYHRNTISGLQNAYNTEGTQGFYRLWDELDEATQKYLVSAYSGMADLATGAIHGGKDVVDAVFAEALAQAEEMRETLLKDKLAEDAAGYGQAQLVELAKKSGFQEQLTLLRDALEDGDFMDVLAGFGEEMTSALLSEHEWLNQIIEALAIAKDGTLELTDATLLMDEHIVGTQEHFLENVNALLEASEQLLASEEEQIAMLSEISDLLSEDDGLDAFIARWASLDNEMQQALLRLSPGLKKLFERIQDGAEDAGDAVSDLDKEIDGISLRKLAREGKVFDDLAGTMEDAEKGGTAFAKRISELTGRAEKMANAYGALTAIQSGALTKADDLSDAYGVLASFTGLSADVLMNDLDPALWMITQDMDMASNSVGWLVNNLFEAAGVQFNAATWKSQLAALAASSDATTAHVARLIQTMLQAAGASLSMSGNTIKVNWGKGNYTPPSARSGGSRGSGGGGGSSKADTSKELSELEKLLDMMEKMKAIKDHQREMMQLAQDYHEARGEIQGVILHLEKEMEVVQGSNHMLEQHVAILEERMLAKQKELQSLARGTEAYDQAIEDLDKLQDLHQDYSKELVKNQTDLEKLTQAIKAQNDAIRDMEIELRELIHQAILDREALNRRMLQGRIDLEDEILRTIERNYEKERDMLLDLAKLKIDTLNEEIRLLDEQLAARKKLAEQEDKSLRLKELEAKLARISADPTRKKEELKLREEIAKLREEIAWDIAEDEVNAQKQSLEEQIQSVEDYMAEVERYYEELMASPRRMIEEFKELLTKTDDEILEWLKQNSEEYADASDAQRQQMVNDWTDMLDDMHGRIEQYWDEVETIIQQGDEAIIAFLKQHSADYQAAGKLQAEKYVDEWLKKLEDLKKAHQQVTSQIKNTQYTVTPTTSGSSSSSSSGSSGSSGGSTTKYKFVVAGKTYGPYSSIAAAEKAKQTEIDKIKANNSGSSMFGQAINLIKAASIVKYATGGLNTSTGLAWLDGTKAKPERVLSAYQTTLFEDMIQSLHAIRTLKIQAPTLKPQLQNAPDQMLNIEGITVQVEKLESEADFEAMAKKVAEYIYREVIRGTPTGGLRLK